MFISEWTKKIQSKIKDFINIKPTQENKKKISEQKSNDKFSNSNNIDRVELSPQVRYGLFGRK
jgi:hypothetical protein